LTNNQNLKVAVLVNEFGDIDIDSQLLVSVDQDMVQLSNGCICCTINDGLVEAVYNVLERADNIDYLVIETTGVADPLPILLTFLGTELRDLTRLDSVITLVDASAFAPDLFNSEAAFKQITYGDMILLNKTDLVANATVEKLEAQIHSLKEGARIIRCQKAAVPLPLILDVGFNDPMAYDAMVPLESADPTATAIRVITVTITTTTIKVTTTTTTTTATITTPTTWKTMALCPCRIAAITPLPCASSSNSSKPCPAMSSAPRGCCGSRKVPISIFFSSAANAAPLMSNPGIARFLATRLSSLVAT
jgi:G3E family GTPase